MKIMQNFLRTASHDVRVGSIAGRLTQCIGFEPKYGSCIPSGKEEVRVESQHVCDTMKLIVPPFLRNPTQS